MDEIIDNIADVLRNIESEAYNIRTEADEDIEVYRVTEMLSNLRGYAEDIDSYVQDALVELDVIQESVEKIEPEICSICARRK